MASGDNFFASVDIGTSKIVVLIADEEDGKIEVFGYGIGPSDGVKNALIIDIDKVAKAISRVVETAYLSCNTRIHNVATNICDLHLSTINQDRQISVSGKKITKENVIEAIKTASATPIPANKQILNASVNHFTIDQDTTAIDQPIGLEATVLGAQVHVSIVSNQAMSSIHQVVEKSDLGLSEVVLDSIASSRTCITQDEKDNGICLIDMGAGVSNISVFMSGGITYSHVFKIGGNQITQNIANAFNTSFIEAERLKIEHGYAQLKIAPADKLIQFKQLDSMDNRYLSLHNLVEVIEKSYLDICRLIKQNLKTKKLDRSLKSGLVLTGGVSLIEGCEGLFVNTFRIRTKLAKVDVNKITGKDIIVSNPIYTCALGLLMHADNDTYLEAVQEYQQTNFVSKIKSLLEL